MKHKLLLLAVMMMAAFGASAQQFDFYSESPSGDTLFYKINNIGGVEVVTPLADYWVTYSFWTGYTQPVGDVIIPDSVEYQGVKFVVNRIGGNVFYMLGGVTSVSIPNTVTEIGGVAFYGTGITSLVIPNSVTSIGDNVCSQCQNLSTLVLSDSLEHIGSEAFYNCTSLTNVSIPAKVSFVGYRAFANCSALDTLIVHNIDITSSELFSDIAFSGSDSIMYLYYDCDFSIPNIITKNKLQQVVIGNNVTSIHANAFQNATSLSRVTIGSSVDTIADNAFRFCSSLDTIFALNDTAPALGANVFQSTPNDKVVVTTCDADYASVWGSDGFVYATGGFSLTLNSNNPAYGTTAFLQAVNCEQTAIIQATPAVNCAFSGWSDGNNDNPRTITLSQNTTLTANFTKTHAVVTVETDNELMGSVNGSGTYAVGSEATLTAVANCNYRFVRWQDNDTVNPRTVSLSSDTAFTAYFELNSDTVFVHDTTYVDVHDTTYIDVHDTTYVDVHDTTYIDVHDTTIVYDTVTLTEYVHDTTIVHDTVTLTEYVHDTTIVTNTIYDTVTLTEYVHDTLWLHDTLVVHDTVYVGISGAEATNAKIYQQGGQVVVAGAEHQTVILYDAVGRALDIKNDEGNELRFDIPATGVYLIKIGTAPARRVMVIR